MSISNRWGAWILLITALIPFDISIPIPHLRNLSVVDFACACGLVAVFVSLGPYKTFKEICRIFQPLGLMLWGGFLLYTTIDSLLLHGEISRALRWGEFLFCFYLASLIPKKDQSETMAPFTILLSFLGFGCALWGVIQFLTHHFDHMAAGASFRQHNALAAFLSLCLPSAMAGAVAQERIKRIFSRIGLTGIIFGMLSASSRGATFSFLASLLALQLFTQKKHRAGLALIIVFIGILTFAISTGYGNWDNGRVIYLKTGISMIKEHPFLGIGPGNYDDQIKIYVYGKGLQVYIQELLYKHRTEFWINLHNIYLQIAVEYGLIGFLLWLAALVWMFFPLKYIFVQKDFDLWLPPFCFLISIVAFLLHNTVDILFTSSFDLLFVIQLAFCRNAVSKHTEGA